jgi:endonuclease/exonuclease/phosphatase family metal-dependent hydrolase
VTSDEKLRVLHWNIHSWRDGAGAPNTAAVAALIRETSPDAVSLVEVNEPWGGPSALAEIAGACGYSWLFVPSLEFDEGGRGFGYGNALLTRVPVTAVHQWRVFSPGRPYDGTEPAEPRSVLLARLSPSRGLSPSEGLGPSLWVGSTHFPASDPGARKIAASTLRRLTRQLTGPWLICGDFNEEPSALFADAGPGAGPGGFAISPDPAKPTYPATRPTVSIDYSIAHPAVVMKTTVLRTPGSDHLPILTIATSP